MANIFWDRSSSQVAQTSDEMIPASILLLRRRLRRVAFLPEYRDLKTLLARSALSDAQPRRSCMRFKLGNVCALLIRGRIRLRKEEEEEVKAFGQQVV